MAKANVLSGVYVGDYGITHVITFKDEDGTVQDISSYSTSQTVYVRSPDGGKLATCSGSFTTDGTDGKLDFAFADGDIDRDGVWEAQALLVSGTAKKRSKIFDVVVEERIGS